MRFLADENIHAELVAWLRGGGHDVAYAAETLVGEPDTVVLRIARDEERIVVTDDKGFGDLVVRRRLASAGVLLLRMGSPAIGRRIERLAAAWPSIEVGLRGNFTVVSDHRVRVRPIPAAGTAGDR